LLRQSQERTHKITHDLDCADEFDSCEPSETAPVSAQSIFDPTLIAPDFAVYKVVDLFRDLGPPSIFCARNQWTPPRTVHLRRTPKCPGHGFSVRGDAPVFISSVEPGGLASLCGLKMGDVIVGVEEVDAKWASHEEVVRWIRAAGDSLRLRVVSPWHGSSSNSLHSLSASSVSSSACSSPAGLVSYATLPSNYHSKSKPTERESGGLFSFSTLKKLKRKGRNAEVSSSSNNLADGGSSWNLRNLLFSKKHSKSVETHLNKSSLLR